MVRHTESHTIHSRLAYPKFGSSLMSPPSEKTKNNNTTIDVKLDGFNYKIWDFLMRVLLTDQKCVASTNNIDGHPFQLQDDSRAMICITNNCYKEILVAIMHLPDTKTILNYLYATYSGVNVQRP
jgi:hypothetical protein